MKRGGSEVSKRFSAVKLCVLSALIVGSVAACNGGNGSGGTSNAPTQSQQVQPSQPSQPSYSDALRQYDKRVFKPYTDSELQDLLSSICSAQTTGVDNQEITRDLVSAGISIDAAAPMIFVAKDYC